MKSLDELKHMNFMDFIELPDSYIRLQGDLTPTQYGAVKIVSNTWSAILDKQTCDLCRSLDGKTLPEGHPDYETYQAPLHDHCRCLFLGWTTESPFKPPIDWEPPDKGLLEKFGNLVGMLPEKVLPEIIEIPEELRKLLPEDKWIKSLTKEEKEMFEIWQRATYSSIDNLRAVHAGKIPEFFDAKKVKQYKKYLKTLDGALDRAVSYKGNVYRGLHDLDKTTIERILKTKTMEFDALSSGTWKYDVAKGFARNLEKDKFSIIFEIKSKTGVKISSIFPEGKFLEEAEVLLRRGSKYKVIGQEMLSAKTFKSKQTWKIILEEIL